MTPSQTLALTWKNISQIDMQSVLQTSVFTTSTFSVTTPAGLSAGQGAGPPGPLEVQEPPGPLCGTRG